MSRRFCLAMLAAVVLAGAAQASPRELSVETVADRWQGTYLCNQGWTGLDLTLEVVEEAEPGRELKATFSFYEIDRNPGVPSGRFLLRGHFDSEDRHMDLAQDRWLERPPRYIMVDLHGRFDPEADTIEGRVSGPGCGDFSLRRAEGPPTAKSWLLGR